MHEFMYLSLICTNYTATKIIAYDFKKEIRIPGPCVMVNHDCQLSGIESYYGNKFLDIYVRGYLD